MLRQVALIFTVCAELGLAARHLGDVSLHGGSGAEEEARAACETMEKNDCKFGKKKAPKGFKCVWMYDCYQAGKKEYGPVEHPSECGQMKMQGIGVCSAVSLTPKITPASIDRDEEETELPSDEDIDEEMEDSEETSDEDVPEVETAGSPAVTETLEDPEPVTAKLEEDEDEKEEDTTAEFDPEEEKPADECGGASVHWKTCGTKSECQYVKKADVESCGVSAWGCYLASDLTC
mmetsp:Transcript_67860/g.111585  ORF Transcript_67860/g.111585 Transcript_67860/m.111585 type:complete len:234 (-) Transcript_67860:140-841(-)